MSYSTSVIASAAKHRHQSSRWQSHELYVGIASAQKARLAMTDAERRGKIRMELQEVQVYIDQDGRVRIEVRGLKGQGCLELTAELEKALGGEIESREMTPEALETAGLEAQNWQLNRH